MKYEGPEKRYIFRHRVGCIAVLYRRRRLIDAFSKDFSRPCAISDLNWRGVRFYAYNKFRKGEIIEVRFDCPVDVEFADDAGQLRACVAWQEWSNSHRAWRTGAYFPDVGDDTRDAILAMLDKAVEHDRKFHNLDQDVL